MIIERFEEMIGSAVDSYAWKVDQLPEYVLYCDQADDAYEKLLGLVSPELHSDLATILESRLACQAVATEAFYRQGLIDGVRLMKMFETDDLLTGKGDCRVGFTKRRGVPADEAREMVKGGADE